MDGKNELTEEIVKRYILISFWIEYRAAVHRGDGITIKPMSAEEYLKNKRKIHDLVGLIKEYLELTGSPPHGIDPGEYLYAFVVHGEKNIRV